MHRLSRMTPSELWTVQEDRTPVWDLKRHHSQLFSHALFLAVAVDIAGREKERERELERERERARERERERERSRECVFVCVSASRRAHVGKAVRSLHSRSKL